MIRVGSFQAKTHLSELLDRVARGEKVVITRRGKPAAMLVPPAEESNDDIAAIVREMLEDRDRSGRRLGRGLSVRQLLEEGRRY